MVDRDDGEVLLSLEQVVDLGDKWRRWKLVVVIEIGGYVQPS